MESKSAVETGSLGLPGNTLKLNSRIKSAKAQRKVFHGGKRCQQKPLWSGSFSEDNNSAPEQKKKKKKSSWLLTKNPTEVHSSSKTSSSSFSCFLLMCTKNWPGGKQCKTNLAYGVNYQIKQHVQTLIKTNRLIRPSVLSSIFFLQPTWGGFWRNWLWICSRAG